MNEVASTAAITLRIIISALLATPVWPHAWCGLADCMWSMDLSRRDTDAVIYLVYIHFFKAITFKANPYIFLGISFVCMF